MKIILEIEDTDLLKPYADEMIKAYLNVSLKMFIINKIKIIKTEVKK